MDEVATALQMGLAKAGPMDYSQHQNVRLVLKGASSGFDDVRCAGCGTLLYRIKGKLQKSADTVVEVKCRKCGKINLG